MPCSEPTTIIARGGHGIAALRNQIDGWPRVVMRPVRCLPFRFPRKLCRDSSLLFIRKLSPTNLTKRTLFLRDSTLNKLGRSNICFIKKRTPVSLGCDSRYKRTNIVPLPHPRYPVTRPSKLSPLRQHSRRDGCLKLQASFRPSYLPMSSHRHQLISHPNHHYREHGLIYCIALHPRR